MSKALELVVTIVGYGVAIVFPAFLIAASGYGLLLAYEGRKEEKAMKPKRINMDLGQRIEVEYAVIPETEKFSADVEVKRVYAYNGAVRVEVTPLLKNNEVPKLREKILEQCREAEGIAQPIPF